MSSLDEVKAMGKRLADHLATKHGIKLKNASLLEALAAQFGYRDWNTLAASLGNTSRIPLAQPSVSPVLATFSASGAPLVLDASALSQNVMILGAGGSGARLVTYHVLESHLAQGHGALIFDFLDDADLMAATQRGLAQAGRASALRRLNFYQPEHSATYNPVGDGAPDQIAARLINLLPYADSPGADYYRQSANYALTAVVGALQSCRRPITLWGLASLLSNAAALLELEHAAPVGRERTCLTLWLDSFRVKDKNGVSLSETRLRDQLGGVLGRLVVLAQGKLGQLLETANPTIRLADVRDRNEVLYVTLPVMGRDETSNKLAALILADFLHALANRESASRPASANFLCVAENLPGWAAPSLIGGLQQLRSAGVALLQHYSTLAHYTEYPASALAQALLANTAHSFVFRQNSVANAQLAEQLIGQHAVLSEKGQWRTEPWFNSHELFALALGEAVYCHQGRAERIQVTPRPG